MIYIVGMIALLAFAFMFWGKKGIRYVIWGIILALLWKTGLLATIVQVILHLVRWIFVTFAYYVTKIWDYFIPETIDFIHFLF